MTCIRRHSIHQIHGVLSSDSETYPHLPDGHLGDYRRKYGLNHLATTHGSKAVLTALTQLDVLHGYIHAWDIWSESLRIIRYVGLQDFGVEIRRTSPREITFEKRVDLVEFFQKIGLFRLGMFLLSDDVEKLSQSNQRLYWKWRGALSIELGEMVAGEESYQKWLSLIDDDVIEQSEIYNDLGVLNYHQRKFDLAKDYLEQALQLRRQYLPADDPRIFTSMSNLGAVLHQSQQFARSLELSQEILSYRQQNLPKDHPHLLSSLHNIGTLLISFRKYDESRFYLEQALELRTQVLGKRHPARLKTQYALTVLYHNIREWELCESTYLENILIKKQVLGVDHPKTHESQIGLACSYRYQGKGKQAKLLLEEVLLQQRKRYGEGHPITFGVLDEYSALLFELNDASALSVLEDVLQKRLQTFGHIHSDTLHTRRNLGGAYVALERWDDASEQYQIIFDVTQEYPEQFDDIIILQSKKNLAWSYRLGMSFDMSKSLWTEIVRWAKEDTSRLSTMVQALEELAWCNLGQGNVDSALKQFTKVKKVFKPEHWRFHYMQTGLGLCERMKSGVWGEDWAEPIQKQIDMSNDEWLFVHRLVDALQKIE